MPMSSFLSSISTLAHSSRGSSGSVAKVCWRALRVVLGVLLSRRWARARFIGRAAAGADGWPYDESRDEEHGCEDGYRDCRSKPRPEPAVDAPQHRDRQEEAHQVQRSVTARSGQERGACDQTDVVQDMRYEPQNGADHRAGGVPDGCQAAGLLVRHDKTKSSSCRPRRGRCCDSASPIARG